jgi:hypothetical protein
MTFSVIEPVRKKLKLLRPRSRIAERRFWGLPVETKDMVCAYVKLLLLFQRICADLAQLKRRDLKRRLQVATYLKQATSLPINAEVAADYFLRSLYRNVEFRLDSERTGRLNGLIAGAMVYNFSLVRKVLFDASESTLRSGLQ